MANNINALASMIIAQLQMAAAASTPPSPHQISLGRPMSQKKRRKLNRQRGVYPKRY